jgi:hypothetical protein
VQMMNMMTALLKHHEVQFVDEDVVVEPQIWSHLIMRSFSGLSSILYFTRDTSSIYTLFVGCIWRCLTCFSVSWVQCSLKFISGINLTLYLLTTRYWTYSICPCMVMYARFLAFLTESHVILNASSVDKLRTQRAGAKFSRIYASLASVL